MTDVRDADLTDVLAGTASRGAVAAPKSWRPLGLRGRPAVKRLPQAIQRAGIRWRPILMMLLYLSPSLLAAGYYGLIASGRYVSHAAFLVRTASKPSGDTGIGAFLRMAGLGRAEDDTYSVQRFLSSRDAVQKLQARLPLAAMYGREGTDWLSRFPSPFYSDTNEDLYRFYTHATIATYNASTGVTTLEVQAFRPDDALAIAGALLTLSEDLVNVLNTRIHVDAVSAAEDEVKHEEARLTDAQVAITSFQNKENMIDPLSSTIVMSEIVGKLQNDLAQQQARIADMTAGSPNNPGLVTLQRQAEVTRGQIAREQARVTSEKDGLADKLAVFQRLSIEREFATKALSLATSGLDAARTDARRKQLYIERIVEPELSDKPTLPLRLWTVFTVLLVNVFVMFIAWMVMSGVKEHISSTR